MCGIVGYVGNRPCEELLLQGLEKLEYRGYDSAGISLLENGAVESVHAVGNLANLRAAVERVASGNGNGSLAPAETGIAHTRWATHGRGTEEKRHPHDDSPGKVHIVLNGIVENHAELRKQLIAEGEEFSSETDAEVVAHLIARHYDGDLAAATRDAYADRRGHYALVAMHAPPPRRGADRNGRGRRNRSRRRPHHRHRRHPDRARRRRGDLGRRSRREGRLRDLHAEGDPRTGRRGRRADHRSAAGGGGVGV